MHDKSSEKGQVLILVVIGIVGLLAMTALAVDGGNTYLDRRKAQNAADTGALAAVLAKIQDGSCANCASVARSRAASNGYNNDGTSNTVAVNNPPGASCAGTTPTFPDDSSQYVQVVIKTKVNTYFASVIGVKQTQNCVDAIAKVAGFSMGQALVALGKTDHCAISKTGSGAITINNAGILDNSNQPDALCQTGSGNITAVDICIAPGGGVNNVGSGHITPAPVSCASQIDDPFASLAPPADPGGACPAVSFTGSSNNTINPGCYTGISQTGSGNLTLNPGIYYLKSGNFSATGSGDISAVGVMLYMKTGSVSFTGSGNFTISPPTSGTYKGMAIYVDRGNGSAVSWTGSGGSTLIGTIYAPASQISQVGSGTNTLTDSQMICDTFSLTGSGNLTIDYHSSNQYSPTAIQFYQ